MERSLKIIVATLLSLVLLSISFGTVSAKESQPDTINSPDEYIDYLEGEIDQDTNALGIKSTSQTQQVLEGFKELSKPKQEKFVDYLNDAGLFAKAFKKLEDLETGESVSLQKGDIVLKKSGPSNDDIRLFSSTWDIWSEYTVEMFGLDVVITRAEARYTANNYRVLDTIKGGGHTVRTLNPTVSMDVLDEDHYKSNGYAYGEVVFSYEIGTPWEGVQIGTITHRVYGDEDGYVDGYAFRNP